MAKAKKKSKRKTAARKPQCLQCEKTMEASKVTRPKIFCSDKCRYRFHNKERRDALAMVRAQQAASPPA